MPGHHVHVIYMQHTVLHVECHMYNITVINNSNYYCLLIVIISSTIVSNNNNNRRHSICQYINVIRVYNITNKTNNRTCREK